MPKITLLFASLHVLLMLALAVPVVLHRNTHKIGIGDGGDKRLARKIRVHGNYPTLSTNVVARAKLRVED